MTNTMHNNVHVAEMEKLAHLLKVTALEIVKNEESTKAALHLYVASGVASDVKVMCCHR